MSILASWLINIYLTNPQLKLYESELENHYCSKFMMAQQQQEEEVDPEVLEAANILMLMFNSGSNSKQQIDPPPLECSTVQRGREATGNESGSSLNLRPDGCAEGCRGSADPLTLTLPSTSKPDHEDVKVKAKPKKPKPKYRGNKKIHQCGECGEIFEFGQQLGGHMRKHYTGELKPKRKKQETEVKSEQQQQGRENSKRLKQHANNYNQMISSNLQHNFMVYNSNQQHREVGCNMKLDLNKVPIEYEIEKLKEGRKAEEDEEKQEKQRQQLSSNLQQDFMVYSNRHHELGCNMKVVLNKTPLEYEIEKLNLNGEEENKKDEKEASEERQR